MMFSGSQAHSAIWSAISVVWNELPRVEHQNKETHSTSCHQNPQNIYRRTDWYETKHQNASQNIYQTIACRGSCQRFVILTFDQIQAKPLIASLKKSSRALLTAPLTPLLPKETTFSALRKQVQKLETTIDPDTLFETIAPEEIARQVTKVTCHHSLC